jgi:2-Cys peroxiredoxin 5
MQHLHFFNTCEIFFLGFYNSVDSGAGAQPTGTVEVQILNFRMYTRISKQAFCALTISHRSLATKATKMASVGFRIPSGLEMCEGGPGNKVTSDTLFKGKKVVVFAVPGAFTPGCSKTHLPGYLADYEKIKAKGVNDIICVSVNDPFVMDEWGKANDCAGKIRMIADHNAALTKALDMVIEIAPFGTSSTRSKRYSAVVEDGEIKVINVEPDNTGLTCSLSGSILSQL